jgi:Caspase domain
MGRQLALSIGIGSADGFRPLPGAVAGAAEFKVWAEAQGFEVLLFDDTEGPVVADSPKTAIADAVEAGDVERLFIFFAGHGIGKGQWEDCWLLSHAMSNSDAAIDLARSLRMAHTCGIPHIAVFADACRTVPRGKLKDVHGQSLFPPTEYRAGRGAEVDRFYSTKSGDTSFELQPAGDDDRLSAYGIYTRCLIAALSGREPAALTEVEGGRERFAVQSRELEAHLEEAVPEAVREVVERRQEPDAQAVTRWTPNVLAWIHAETLSPGDGEPLRTAGAESPVGGKGAESDVEEVKARSPHADDALAWETDLNLRSQDPHLAEFGISISADDSSIPQVFDARGRGRSIQVTRYNRWTTASWETPGPELVELEDRWCGEPMWLLGAMIPGYRTAARIGERGAMSVAYVPHGAGSPDEVVARANALVAGGSLKSRDPRQQQHVIERAFEELNPTLATIAAYALDRGGEHERARELLDRFLTAGVYVPFDLALVARFGGLTEHEQILPGYPLMTRGWAFLDEVPSMLKLADRVRRLLAPSPWATGLNLPADVIEALLGLGVSGGPVKTPPSAGGSTPSRRFLILGERMINLLPGRTGERSDTPEFGPMGGV